MIHPHAQLVLPAGIDGPIVKPLEWRKWNDSKLFTGDWLDFIRPIKICRRIRIAYHIAQWEREKQFMREWWFKLSQRERDYLIGRRVDGEFSNIVQAVWFKGPRYQRGSVSASAQGTVAAAAPSGTLELSSTDNFAINIDFNPPSPLDAGFGLLRDGTHDRVNNSGQNQINSSGDWITPRNSTVGDDYETKWNLTAGSAARINDESYSEDTWTTLSVGTGRGRYVGKSTSSASVQDTFEIDIGDDGASSSDVNQDYTVEAGDLV